MNSDKFLDLYKQLELSVKSRYNLANSDSISYFLGHHEDYIEYEDEIRYMSDVRNIISHNPKVNEEYAIDVSNGCLKFMEMLIDKVNNYKTLKDIMVPLKNIHFAYETSLVKDVISSLSDKIYNHVPIKNGDKIIGVFDEMSLFHMIKDGVKIDENLKFRDIQKYIDLNRNNCSKYLYAKGDSSINDLKSTFAKLYKEGKKVGLVFVHDEDNKLTGLLSTTDILGK